MMISHRASVIILNNVLYTIDDRKKMLLYVVHMTRYSHQKASNNYCRNILYVQHFVLINIAAGVIFVGSG